MTTVPRQINIRGEELVYEEGNVYQKVIYRQIDLIIKKLQLAPSQNQKQQLIGVLNLYLERFEEYKKIKPLNLYQNP